MLKIIFAVHYKMHTPQGHHLENRHVGEPDASMSRRQQNGVHNFITKTIPQKNDHCLFVFCHFLCVFRLCVIIMDQNASEIKIYYNKENKSAWFTGFMQRHQNVSLRQLQAASIARTDGFNRESVEQSEKLLNSPQQHFPNNKDLEHG